VEVMSKVLREAADRGVPVLFSSHQLDLVERLCDRVGIVRAGRMVESGRVTDLQSVGPPRLVVAGPDPATWAVGLAGVTVVEQSADRAVVELAAGTDDQVVLRAALAAGPV